MKTSIIFTQPAPVERTQEGLGENFIAEAWLSSDKIRPCNHVEAKNPSRYEYLRLEPLPPNSPNAPAACSTSRSYELPDPYKRVPNWAKPNRYHFPIRIVGLTIFADRRGVFAISGSTSRQDEEPINHLEDHLTDAQLTDIYIALWNYYKQLPSRIRMDELGERTLACVNALSLRIGGR